MLELESNLSINEASQISESNHYSSHDLGQRKSQQEVKTEESNHHSISSQTKSRTLKSIKVQKIQELKNKILKLEKEQGIMQQKMDKYISIIQQGIKSKQDNITAIKYGIKQCLEEFDKNRENLKILKQGFNIVKLDSPRGTLKTIKHTLKFNVRETMGTIRGKQSPIHKLNDIPQIKKVKPVSPRNKCQISTKLNSRSKGKAFIHLKVKQQQQVKDKSDKTFPSSTKQSPDNSHRSPGTRKTIKPSSPLRRMKF